MMSPFSRWAGLRATQPSGVLTLDDFFAEVQSDTHRIVVQSIRDLTAAGKITDADKFKKNLPAVTISGVFHERKVDGLKHHSGLLVLDFDKVASPTELRDNIIMHPNCAGAFRSPSGTGVKAVFIASPWVKDKDTHRTFYKHLRQEIESKFGAKVDTSGSDVSRLCFLSYDPELKINLNAVPSEAPKAETFVEKSDCAAVPRKSVASAGAAKRRRFSPETVADMLAVIPPHPPYDKWIRIISAVLVAVGDLKDAETILNAWSKETAPGEYAAKLTSPLSHFGTDYLMRIAREHGYSKFPMPLVSLGAKPYTEAVTYAGTRYMKTPFGWAKAGQGSVERSLVAMGVSKVPEVEGGLSDLQLVLATIDNNSVIWAGALGGYRDGVHMTPAGRILVTHSPVIIRPTEGDFSNIREFLTTLLGDKVQMERFIYWLKWAYETLTNDSPGYFRKGQALALCGPPQCGKSLLAEIIKLVLGGRAGKPYRYMTGRTDFNADFIGCEVLIIDDEMESPDQRMRQKFATNIKGMLFAGTQSVHAKGKDAFSVMPFSRLVVCTNDNPESLSVLPPMRHDLLDKLMLWKCAMASIPGGSGITAEARMKLIESELPAFIDFLLSTEIPEELRDARCGVKAYHHPDILSALGEQDEGMTLLSLLRRYANLAGVQGGVISGTALAISTKLKNYAELAKDAQDLLGSLPSNKCGKLLGELAQLYPETVSRPSNRRAEVVWTVRLAE